MNSLFVAISVGILAQYEQTIDLPIPPLPTAEVQTRPLGQPVAGNGTSVSEGCFATPWECVSDDPYGHQFCIKPIRYGSLSRARAGHDRPQLCIKPTGDMIQHQSPPGVGSYYYFRPYNTSQLIKQRTSAVSSGVDSRMPYSNAVFRQVYETVEPQFLLRKN